MGKKRNKNDNATTIGSKVKDKESKGLKSYSTAAPGWASAAAKEVKADDEVKKVSLPAAKEAAILDLIKQHQADKKTTGAASLRLTAKKLTGTSQPKS